MEIGIKKDKIEVDGAAVAFQQTPNHGGALKPEGIILHDTAGGLEAGGSISWLCNPAAKASAHVVLARDGKITQLAPLDVVTWHAGKSAWKGRPNVNNFAIGIEIVNPGKLASLGGDQYINDLKVKVKGDDDHVVREATTSSHGHGFWLDYTAKQIEAVILLCAAIREAYGVKWIGTHYEISPGRKIDVNAIFPLDHVRGAVFGPSSGTSAKADDNTGLTTVASLNMREAPGAGNKVIMELPRDTKVAIRGVDHVGPDKWLLVDALGKSGWVAARFVDLD